MMLKANDFWVFALEIVSRDALRRPIEAGRLPEGGRMEYNVIKEFIRLKGG